MATQLNVHRDEKQSMRNWSFESVMLNNIPEITDRIKWINDLHIEIKNDLMNEVTKDNKELITKQFVHMANYAMMGWLKSK